MSVLVVWDAKCKTFGSLRVETEFIPIYKDGKTSGKLYSYPTDYVYRRLFATRALFAFVFPLFVGVSF